MIIIKENCDLGGNLTVSGNRKSANTARNALEKSKKVRQLYFAKIGLAANATKPLRN
jgi:inosine-uridine nucleoside N-ribohydrolase